MTDDLVFGIPADFMKSYDFRSAEIIERHRKLFTPLELERMLSEELERFRSWYPSLPAGIPVIVGANNWSISTVIWNAEPKNESPDGGSPGHSEYLGSMIVRVDGSAATDQCDIWGCRRCDSIAARVGDHCVAGSMEEIMKDVGGAASAQEAFSKVPLMLAVGARVLALRSYN